MCYNISETSRPVSSGYKTNIRRSKGNLIYSKTSANIFEDPQNFPRHPQTFTDIPEHSPRCLNFANYSTQYVNILKHPQTFTNISSHRPISLNILKQPKTSEDIHGMYPLFYRYQLSSMPYPHNIHKRSTENPQMGAVCFRLANR